MITIIAAVARNGAIGAGGRIPWSAPEDLRFFKETTMGHAVVMGRKTWGSIPEKNRPLSGRTNAVVSRGPRTTLDPEVWLTISEDAPIERALAHVAHLFGDVFIIGGAQVYAEALPLADRLLITEVDVEVLEADAFFPRHELFRPPSSPTAMFYAVANVRHEGQVLSFHTTEVRRGSDPRLTFVTWERLP